MLRTLPFLALVAVIMPGLALMSRMQARSHGVPAVLRVTALVVQVLIVQGALAGLALLAAGGERIAIEPALQWHPTAILLTVGFLGAALLAAWYEGRSPTGRVDPVRQQLRRVPLSHPGWLAANAAAAIGEELAYRVVLTVLLSTYLGALGGAFVSALLFGLGHMTQGWRGLVFSIAFGLALQMIVSLGGLSLAVMTHFAYDIGAHAIGRRLALSPKPEALNPNP